MHIIDFSFGSMVALSLRASVVLLGVLAVRWFLRRCSAVRWLDWLWLALLVRLVVPAFPGSTWSLFNWLQPPSAGVIEGAVPWFVSDGFHLVEEMSALSAPTVADFAVRASAPVTMWIWSPLPTVWALGVVVVFGFRIRSVILARRLVRTARPMTENELLVALAAAREATGCSRTHAFDVREAAEVESPAVAGLLTGVVLLPPGLLGSISPEARSHILMHEIGHLKRRDLWVQALFSMASALHWWNPLVWMALHFARADREVACDDWVMRRIGEQKAIDYGATLIEVSTLWPRNARNLLRVTMAEDRRGLRDRIRRIAAFAPGTRAGGILAATLVVAFSLVALADHTAAPPNVPLAFTSWQGVRTADSIEVDQLWANAPTFVAATSFRVRGRYHFVNCPSVVLTVQELDPRDSPNEGQVKHVPCGRGSFDMTLTVPAPNGLRIWAVDTTGTGTNVLDVRGLFPAGTAPRKPFKTLSDIFRTSGDQVPVSHASLAWTVGAGSPLPPLPFERDSSVPRSARTDHPTVIAFENQTNASVFIDWNDLDGNRRRYWVLPPGEVVGIWTWLGHVWVVSNDRGEQLGVAVSQREPGRAVIR